MSERTLHHCDHPWRVVHVIQAKPTRRTIARCDTCNVGGEVIDASTLSVPINEKSQPVPSK